MQKPASWLHSLVYVEMRQGQIGCSPDSLKTWLNRAQAGNSVQGGTAMSSEHERIKALEKENKELRRANEILKTASAFFAQAEVDRRLR